MTYSEKKYLVKSLNLRFSRMYKWQKCWMFIWLEGSEALTSSAKTDYLLSLTYFEVDVHTLLRVISTGIVAPIICKYFSFYFRCFSTFWFLFFVENFHWKPIDSLSVHVFRYSFPWFAFTGALSLSRSKLWWLSFMQILCQVQKTSKRSLFGN